MRALSFFVLVLTALLGANHAAAQVPAQPSAQPSTQPPPQLVPPAPVDGAPLQSAMQAPQSAPPQNVMQAPQTAPPNAPAQTAPPQGWVAPQAAPTVAPERAPFDESDGEEGYEDVSEPIGLAGRLAINATLDVLWYLDTANDAFARSRGLTSGGFSVALTTIDFSRQLLLDFGLGWRTESSQTVVLQAFNALYESHATYVDATLRFELTPWFVPRARVSAGLQYLSATLSNNSGSSPLDGGAFAFVSSVGAGVELLGRLGAGLTSRESQTAALTLALIVEGGLVVGTNSSLTLAPREPVDDEVAADRLPVVGTNIGSLGGVAPYLRISGALRF